MRHPAPTERTRSMQVLTSIVCLGTLGAVGCAPDRPVLPEGLQVATESPRAAPTPTQDVGSPPTAPESTAMPTASATVEPKPTPSPFRPAAFTPPSERSASDEDGVWLPWHERDHDFGPLMYRAVVHPHPVSRFVRMDVVAMDLSRVSVDWVIGTKDDGHERLSQQQVPGLVPTTSHERTLAIFNGGFQPRHGRWGIASRGVSLQAMKQDGCVVGLREVGTVEAQVVIGNWSTLRATIDDFVTVRQTPPCLLEGGIINPALETGRTKAWAGKDPTRRTRRRSALGLDAERKILYYAVGTETEALDLARGMKAIGADTALQLDINWSWTRFLLPGRTEEGRIRVAETLVPEMVFAKNEYFSLPSERDFFFVVVRD